MSLDTLTQELAASIESTNFGPVKDINFRSLVQDAFGQDFDYGLIDFSKVKATFHTQLNQELKKESSATYPLPLAVRTRIANSSLTATVATLKSRSHSDSDVMSDRPEAKEPKRAFSAAPKADSVQSIADTAVDVQQKQVIDEVVDAIVRVENGKSSRGVPALPLRLGNLRTPAQFVELKRNLKEARKKYQGKGKGNLQVDEVIFYCEGITNKVFKQANHCFLELKSWKNLTIIQVKLNVLTRQQLFIFKSLVNDDPNPGYDVSEVFVAIEKREEEIEKDNKEVDGLMSSLESVGEEKGASLNLSGDISELLDSPSAPDISSRKRSAIALTTASIKSMSLNQLDELQERLERLQVLARYSTFDLKEVDHAYSYIFLRENIGGYNPNSGTISAIFSQIQQRRLFLNRENAKVRRDSVASQASNRSRTFSSSSTGSDFSSSSRSKKKERTKVAVIRQLDDKGQEMPEPIAVATPESSQKSKKNRKADVVGKAPRAESKRESKESGVVPVSDSPAPAEAPASILASEDKMRADVIASLVEKIILSSSVFSRPGSKDKARVKITADLTVFLRDYDLSDCEVWGDELASVFVASFTARLSLEEVIKNFAYRKLVPRGFTPPSKDKDSLKDTEALLAQQETDRTKLLDKIASQIKEFEAMLEQQDKIEKEFLENVKWKDQRKQEMASFPESKGESATATYKRKAHEILNGLKYDDKLSTDCETHVHELERLKVNVAKLKEEQEKLKKTKDNLKIVQLGREVNTFIASNDLTKPYQGMQSRADLNEQFAKAKAELETVNRDYLKLTDRVAQARSEFNESYRQLGLVKNFYEGNKSKEAEADEESLQKLKILVEELMKNEEDILRSFSNEIFSIADAEVFPQDQYDKLKDWQESHNSPNSGQEAKEVKSTSPLNEIVRQIESAETLLKELGQKKEEVEALKKQIQQLSSSQKARVAQIQTLKVEASEVVTKIDAEIKKSSGHQKSLETRCANAVDTAVRKFSAADQENIISSATAIKSDIKGDENAQFLRDKAKQKVRKSWYDTEWDDYSWVSVAIPVLGWLYQGIKALVWVAKSDYEKRVDATVAKATTEWLKSRPNETRTSGDYNFVANVVKEQKSVADIAIANAEVDIFGVYLHRAKKTQEEQQTRQTKVAFLTTMKNKLHEWLQPKSPVLAAASMSPLLNLAAPAPKHESKRGGVGVADAPPVQPAIHPSPVGLGVRPSSQGGASQSPAATVLEPSPVRSPNIKRGQA